MADVARERGQLIILTGLLVAIALVAMVLLLNTAIYTENLASRGVDQSGREAVEYRAAVTDGVGGLMERENDREHPNWDSVNASVTDGIETFDNFTARSYAAGGTLVRLDLSTGGLHEGRLIRQNTSGPFEGSSGDADWTLATGVEDTRGFVMNVERSNLNETNETLADSSGAFHVQVTGGSQWNAYVYRNQSTNNVTIATGSGGPVTEHCSVDAAEVTLNLSSGTIDEDDCPGFLWAEGVSSPYSVEYVNGDNATGTYNLTVNTTSMGASLNDGTSNPTSPYYVPAVYSASFEVSYRSPTLTYRTEIRVAPGEPK